MPEVRAKPGARAHTLTRPLAHSPQMPGGACGFLGSEARGRVRALPGDFTRCEGNGPAGGGEEARGLEMRRMRGRSRAPAPTRSHARPPSRHKCPWGLCDDFF